MKKNIRGFTLIEILVVIAVMGVLAAVVLFALNPLTQIKKTRDVQRKVDIDSIQKALERYYLTNGSYPQTEWVCSNSGGNWIPGLSNAYIKTMPVDPVNSPNADCPNGLPRNDSGCYRYCYYSGGWCSLLGRDYILHTRFEADSSSSLSQKQFYDNAGNACSLWSEGAANGVYTVNSAN